MIRSTLCNPHLPVLESTRSALGTLPASIRFVVGLQHLLGSTVTLIDALAQQRREVFLLGKPYSTSPQVMDFIRRERDWWVHPESVCQAIDVDNDSEMDRRIEELLDLVATRMRERNFAAEDRVLLIDDGGRAIRMLHGNRFRHLLSHFVCVEQTRCGVSTLEDMQLQLPVVNVAQSAAKLQHESPLIADSVIHEIRRALWGMHRRGIRVARGVSILGFGSIGAAVADAFGNSEERIRVFDSQQDRARLARSRGLQVVDSKQELLAYGGLIVGCTGRPSVGPDDYDRIAHNAVVVSASSSDLEFQAWNLRPGATCLGRINGHGSADPHPCFSLYRVHRRDHGFYLVNGGFPVNFTGEVDPIAPESIQLTRSLLYAGAVQAANTMRSGWCDLDHDAQAIILDAFQPARAA